MNTLHNKDEYRALAKPEGGLQASLCSNNARSCSSPSGFISTNFISKDNALDYLAGVLVGAFLDHKKRYANANNKTSGDILPSINQRTG